MNKKFFCKFLRSVNTITMSGVVVIVCIPTEQHEKILIQRGKKRVTIREDLNQYPSNFGHSLNTNPLQNLSNKHDLNDTEYQTMHKVLE